MIRTFTFHFEQKPPILLYTFKIGVHTLPEEVFIGKRPNLSHLRIFGCPVYIHVPKEKRSKLDPIGKKIIFVGLIHVRPIGYTY